jgi:hypothetical protein
MSELPQASQALFNFQLEPLERVTPWGERPQLHWFALTQGSYWMNVGTDELFRYSDEVLSYWESTGYVNPGPHESYFVMQLWSDLDDILPSAIEPVPMDVIVRIGEIERARRLILPPEHRVVPADVLLRLASDDDVESSTVSRLCFDATEWWRARRMPVMHLVCNPDIRIWREGNTVSIRWNNSESRVNGQPAWTTQYGIYRLPFEQFCLEVRDFGTHFREQMASRVNEICDNPPASRVAVDRDGLRRAQDEFACSEPGVLPIPAQTDWEAVRNSLDRLMNLL